MESFSCILFDFEGVLFNPSKIMLESFKRAFSKCHETIQSIESLNEYLQFSPSAIIKKLNARNPKKILKEYDRAYLELAQNSGYVVLYENTVSVLKSLKLIGVKMGIVTSQKKIRFDAIAANANILPLFNVIITPSECGLSGMKPSPLGIKMALEKLNELPANSAYVGDSPKDVIAAKRANVFSIYALWGLYPKSTILDIKPDYLCNSVENILEIINR